MTAFVAAVNFNAMLICLCVLCGLLICANAVVAVLIAKSRKQNGKIMQKDVYQCETDDKTSDSDEIAILENVEKDEDNSAKSANEANGVSKNTASLECQNGVHTDISKAEVSEETDIETEEEA